MLRPVFPCVGVCFVLFFASILFHQLLAQDPEDDEELRQKINEAAREHGMDPYTSHVMIPPKVSDEERGSHHMPKYLRCSGCAAVAYQFEQAYKKALKSVKAGKRLPLADQIDVAESVCDKGFGEYGLKDVRGKKMLSGPGLGADKFPGVMEGGGKWEARMKTICLELVEEFEEEGIYELYEEDKDLEKGLSKGLCTSFCKEGDQDNPEAEASSEKDEL